MDVVTTAVTVSIFNDWLPARSLLLGDAHEGIILPHHSNNWLTGAPRGDESGSYPSHASLQPEPLWSHTPYTSRLLGRLVHAMQDDGSRRRGPG